ncbi:MAG: FKBP-type peptidyl-prolyl cis-trans isomerase [Bacteroidota bacterium]
MKLFFLFLIIIFTSCNRETEQRAINLPAGGEIEKAILKVNKYITKRNRDHIRGFIRRTGWEMQQSGSGLWYNLTGQANDSSVSPGDNIRLNYKLYLIDGTAIASSEYRGALSFTVGQGGVESGLEEAVLLMSEGMGARLIIPPHLAYGNFGYPEKGIPPGAILIYKIELIDIQKNQ